MRCEVPCERRSWPEGSWAHGLCKRTRKHTVIATDDVLMLLCCSLTAMLAGEQTSEAYLQAIANIRHKGV